MADDTKANSYIYNNMTLEYTATDNNADVFLGLKTIDSNISRQSGK